MFESLKTELGLLSKKTKTKTKSSDRFRTAITEKLLPIHIQIYILNILVILKGKAGEVSYYW